MAVFEKTEAKIFKEIDKYRLFRQQILKRRSQDNLRYVLFKGGRGSGKSKHVAELITRFLFEFRLKVVIFRKHEAQNKDSTYSELVAHLKENRLPSPISSRAYRIQKSPKMIETRNKRGAKGIAIWKGLAFHTRIKSIHRPDISILEEMEEFTYDDFLTLEHSIRHERALIIGIFNPPHEGEDSWIYKHFFSQESDPKIQEMTMILETNYLDNPYLDSKAVIAYESLKKTNPYEYERSILGLWVKNQESLIFPVFKEMEGDFTPPSNALVLQGLDFGYTNPTAFIRAYFYKDEKGEETIFVSDERYKSKLDTSSMINYLSELQDIEHWTTFCDAEDPSRIQDLKLSGFNVQTAQKPQGSVMAGINFIKTRKLIVHKSCRNLIHELKNYSWKRNPNGGFYYGKIADGCLDHAIDALRYALNREIMRDYSKSSIMDFVGRSHV